MRFGSFLYAALFIALNSIPSAAQNSCNEGRPVKSQCFCQCTGFQASARADGACSVAERVNRWCAISYNGRTGSLGPNSIPSSVPDTSFSTSSVFNSGPLSLPDYRTSEYAEIVRHYSSNTTSTGELIGSMLALASSGQASAVPEQLATTLFLWARGGYVSLPDQADDSSAFADFDAVVADVIFSDPVVYQTFFAGADGDIYRPSDEVVVARGYLRISLTGDEQVKVIFRELMPD